MSVIKKLVSLLRGSVREIGESVVDANATRIYEQEILDAKSSIDQAKRELAGVMAKEIQTARAMERLQAEILRYESLAVEALNKGQESLAEEVAGKVAELDQEHTEQTNAHAAFAVQVGKLKALIKNAEAKIREHEREISVARTTESVYRATSSISDNIASTGSRLSTARESLERIKKRHEDLADRMTAADSLDKEFGHRALEEKLNAAGIGDNADRQRKIMARIRTRAEGGTTPRAGDEPAA
ncbi:PspA/IM30 family protein [Denitromonas halophila]|uniref:PspA/IM30 family protein n=1 Tax=Denitromonas halophila TaxID=1629404 RepID=A0A557QFF3_9RHOO|nr:PspA/IM30 family protein [Denitromonas halophila]TVO51624.1 PspA/IM30 family protein [Denitromonas halophila]